MPLELQVIRAAEFVRMGGHGKFDVVASCAALAELARACKRRGIHRALLDVREAQSELNPTDLAAIVNTFRQIGFTHDECLAVLHAGDPYHRARTFAFISRMRGWTVQAFGEFEEALNWLSSFEAPPPASPEKLNSSKRIPVVELADKPAAKKKSRKRKQSRARAPSNPRFV